MQARQRAIDRSKRDEEIGGLRKQFASMLRESDRRGAQRLLKRAVADGYSPTQLLVEVVGPAIEDLGEMWIGHVMSLPQIYVAGLIAEDSVDLLFPASHQAVSLSIGKVIIATAQGDHHGLGRKIVAAFLRGAGFEVHDLGLSVSPRVLVDTALQEKADLIAVSALITEPALNIRKVREEMTKRGASDIRLLVGGVVFRTDPKLWTLAGADAMAPNAYEAIAVAKRLLEEKSGHK
ncbi:MAG: cobalamin-dependent protein [Chloroflexi bacterium]|nr:cobalamin-dependent protein [Chloroflexota bacterium]MDA8188749.1 cobalamin-dependent protein [Dehalococcoidales bacterium]